MLFWWETLCQENGWSTGTGNMRNAQNAPFVLLLPPAPCAVASLCYFTFWWRALVAHQAQWGSRMMRLSFTLIISKVHYWGKNSKKEYQSSNFKMQVCGISSWLVCPVSSLEWEPLGSIMSGSTSLAKERPTPWVEDTTIMVVAGPQYIQR